jgi:hypothetical protein
VKGKVHLLSSMDLETKGQEEKTLIPVKEEERESERRVDRHSCLLYRISLTFSRQENEKQFLSKRFVRCERMMQVTTIGM